MKKTWFALLLAVVMLASMFVGCTQKPAEKPVEAAPVVTEAPKPTEAPKEEPKTTEEPAPEPTAEPKLESEPEPEGPHKLVVLNTLVKDIETVKSEDSRFNAYWLPSYKLGEIFEKNSRSQRGGGCDRLQRRLHRRRRPCVPRALPLASPTARAAPMTCSPVPPRR